MPWIDHPACQEPVSWMRWAKWRIAEKLNQWAYKLEMEAIRPNCEMCGTPRNRGDHSHCDELPF